jgi:hypothetical protein
VRGWEAAGRSRCAGRKVREAEALAAAFALASTKGRPRPLELSLEQSGETVGLELDYRVGAQHAHLVRDQGRPDVLSEILAPRSIR